MKQGLSRQASIAAAVGIGLVTVLAGTALALSNIALTLGTVASYDFGGYGPGYPVPGTVQIHIFKMNPGDSIPWHLAKKKVPHLGSDGRLVEPKTENALKFEKFIFDVLPLAERWTVAATERSQEFAPLKNATGDDSIDTARSALTDVAATWLEQAGAVVSRDPQGKVAVPVEISPLFALDAAEIKAKIKPGVRIEKATYFE